MRDGGKGDLKRKLVVPEEVFNANWETIFGKKKVSIEEVDHGVYVVEVKEDKDAPTQG